MSKRPYISVPGLALLVVSLAAAPGYAAPQDPDEALAQAQAALQRALAERQQYVAQALTEKQATLAQAMALREAALRQALAGKQQYLARAMAEGQQALTQGWESLQADESGWLGVEVQEVTSEKAKELKLPAVRGAIVSEVEANSPAAKAGLKAGDVVTEYNGERVEGTLEFRRLVRETPAGRTVQLTAWRDGKTQSVSAELGSWHAQVERNVREAMPRRFDFNFELPRIGGNLFVFPRAPMLGISVDDLSGQLGNYFGAPDGEGVLITEVRSGTPAEKAGLKAGDVIIKLDGERVRNSGELRARLREKRDAKSVALTILRKGAEMSIQVEPEHPQPPDRARVISRRAVL